MMVSPKAAKEAGDKFGLQAGVRRAVQVRRARAAGPHRGREVRRLLEQGQRPHRPHHLSADRRRDRAARQPEVRRPRPDRARARDRHQGCEAPTRRLKLSDCRTWATRASPSMSANGDKAKNPLGQNAKVRQALELAIDREAINQVVFNGEFVPGNQWVSPEQRLLPEERPGAEARRRQGQGADQGSGRADADRRRLHGAAGLRRTRRSRRWCRRWRRRPAST